MSQQAIESLIVQIDDPRDDLRKYATNELADVNHTNRLNPQDVVAAVLDRLKRKPLSRQCLINCLAILWWHRNVDWTQQELTDAREIVAGLTRKKLSQGEIDYLKPLVKALPRVHVSGRPEASAPQSATHSENSRPQLDGMPITTLEVRIQTGATRGLSMLPDLKDVPGVTQLPKVGPKINESDDVYLDLGPHAWDLRHDFPPGQEFRRTLDLTGLNLSESDITQIRLEKKGILGFTNAPDSFLYGVGFVPSVATAVGMLRRSVQTQSYILTQAEHVVGQKQSALEIANDAFDGAAKAAADAEAILADAESHLADLGQKISDWNRRLNDIAGDLIAKATGWIPGVGKAVDKLNKEKKDLEQKLSAVTNEVAQWTIRKQQALTDLQIKTANKAAKLQAKVAAETEYTVAKTALDSSRTLLNACQQKLVEVEAVAQKLPSPDLFPTTAGEWDARQVTVLVNGKPVGPFFIGERLRRSHYAWIKLLGNFSDSERFARGLRTELPPSGAAEQGAVWNAILKHPEKIFNHPDLFTTEFKNEDISGWEDYPKDRPHVPIAAATVTGKLVRPPSEGTDANVSLDLEVQAVTVDGATIAIDAAHAFRQTRYIRIEYQFGTDRRFDGWHVNDVLQVQGRVRWDTDHEGFFELHPGGVPSVNKL